MKKYVYIGRFQLPHIGHEAVIRHAIENADSFTLLIGSSNVELSNKNPFTFEERKRMMEAVCERVKKEKGKDINIEILPLPDFDDNDRWVEEVKSLTRTKKDETVYLAGCKKDGDASVFYLDLFPSWKMDLIEEVSLPGIDVISSTKLRELYFNGKDLPNAVSEDVKNILNDMKKESPSDLKVEKKRVIKVRKI